MTIIMPKSWTESKPQSTTVRASPTRNRIEAMDMSDSVAGRGLDPVTKQPMIPMKANGHDVLVGLESKIVLPIKDV